MSRDGWLPPGVTDQHIDEASAGFYVEEPYQPTEQDMVFNDLHRMREMAEQIAGMGVGYRAALMETIDIIIRENNLDTLAGMKVAAE